MSDSRRFWYPGANGEPAGPAPAEVLRDWLAAGALRPASPLCAEGTQEWRPASEYPELADAIPAFAAAAGAPTVSPGPPATRGASPAPGAAARPSVLQPIPYTPGTKPSVPGPYTTFAHPLAEIAPLLDRLRVYDQPPPPVPGPRWRPRLMLCGALLLLALIVAVVDLAMGFPQGPFAYLVPVLAAGVLLVVAATGAPRPRPEWMRVKGPAGCLYALVGLPLASALSVFVFGESVSSSPVRLVVGAVLVLALAALLDNRERPPATPRYDLSRMENCKAVVEALEHDAMPGKPATGWLDLTGPRQGSKLCRQGTAASGRQIRLYRDEWWRITVPLRDGNRLRISAVDRVKVKDAVRRRRRTKPEVEETMATLEVKLGVNTAAYRTKPHFTPATCGDSLKPGPIQTTPDSVSTVAALRGLPARFRPKDALALLALVYARLEPLKPEGGGTP